MRKDRMPTMARHAALPRDRPDCRGADRPPVRGLCRRGKGPAAFFSFSYCIVRYLGLVALLLAPCLAQAQASSQGELGINVYGLSYHFEREEARELGYDNE